MLETTPDRQAAPTLSEAPAPSLTQMSGQIAQAMGLPELPHYLEDMAGAMVNEWESADHPPVFLHRLAAHLRQQADAHPAFHELREISNRVTDSLGENYPEDNRWDPGECQVMAEERLVWQKLREGFLMAKSPNSLALNKMLDAYEQEFGWWATTGELTPGLMAVQRELYLATNGAICDYIQEVRRMVHPAPPLKPVAGVLGNLNPQDTLRIAADIQRDGFAVFPGAMSADMCANLEEFARTNPVTPQTGGSQFHEPATFDIASKNKEAVRFKIGESQALAREDLLNLAFDPSLVAVAQAYLGSEVTYTSSFLRWSHATGGPADSKAAQLFHFDLNQLNFLKLLIYVKDVDPQTGPHSYVRGSHREKPAELLRSGRVSDAEISQHYAPEDIRDICGPRGTVILADTRGYHRGKVLEQGERLVYFSKFSASLAGKGVPDLEMPATAWMREQKAQNPRLWHHVRLS